MPLFLHHGRVDAAVGKEALYDCRQRGAETFIRSGDNVRRLVERNHGGISKRHRSKAIAPAQNGKTQMARFQFVISPRQGTTQDRKSTRLNSSHTVISYA